MILVTNIEYCEVPRDIWTVEIPTSDLPYEGSGTVYTEDVRGTRYLYPDGRMIVLGMTERVRSILGLPIGEVNHLRISLAERRYDIEKLNKELKEYKAHVCRINQMTFWDRLKFLFTSYITE